MNRPDAPERGRLLIIMTAMLCATMVCLVALTPPPDRAEVVTVLCKQSPEF